MIMNVKQAKQLDFPELLSKMGYHPIAGGIKKGGNEIWYKSPLAAEKSASFHLTKGSKVAWVFKCFSSGKEGTILDFVMAHEGYSTNDVKSALAFLRTRFQGPLFEPNKKRVGGTIGSAVLCPSETLPNSTGPDRELQFLEDLPLKSGKILMYLQNVRMIPPDLAIQYLRLVRYKNLNKNQTYFGFGMENRAGGFEVRAASDDYSFKSALIARDISVVQGSSDEGSALVFEGMMDFLSFLTMTSDKAPLYDAIILHSVNSYARCVEFIRNKDYRRIHTFLDNDDTGQKYTSRFEADLGAKSISHSAGFLPYKDVNEALKAGLLIKFFSPVKGDTWDCLPA